MEVYVPMPDPREVVVAFRTRPAVARRIREHARADARTVSSFLAFYLERALAELDREARRDGR